MTTRVHVPVSSDNFYERGVQRAALLGDRLSEACAQQQAEMRGYGLDVAAVREAAEQTFTAIADWDCRYAGELRGLADGAGMPVWRAVALNAATELLLSPGCLPADRGNVPGLEVGDPDDETQSWTWLEDLAPAWHTQAVSGGRYSYVGVTVVGTLSRVAVNSRGLAAFVSEQARSTHETGAVPMHLWLAALIENCASVDEAQQFLAEMPRRGAYRPHDLVTAVAMPGSSTLLVLDVQSAHSHTDGWIELVAGQAA